MKNVCIMVYRRSARSIVTAALKMTGHSKEITYVSKGQIALDAGIPLSKADARFTGYGVEDWKVEEISKTIWHLAKEQGYENLFRAGIEEYYD